MFYKNTTISLLSVAVFFLSVTCDFDQPPVEKEQQIKPVFSDKNEKIGQVTYKALLKTVRQAKSNGVSLKDKEAIEQLAYAHSLEELRAVHLISEDEFLEAQAAPNQDVLLGATADKTADTAQKLSPSAQKILSKLQKAVAESPTYEDFTKKLVTINMEIPLTVPAKEQEAVQRGIAIIHYSLEAIDALDKEGFFEKDATTKKVDKAGFLDISLLRRKQSWWNSWGKCAASIAGSAIVTAGTLGLAGAAVGTVTLPVLGTVAGSTVGIVTGLIGGALIGARDGC